MKVGIYSPYLGGILGGGERYLLTIAEYLSRNSHQVDIFWDSGEIAAEVKRKLRLDISRVNFVEDIFSSKSNLLKRYKKTSRYDILIYLSDGSLPLLFGKKNLVHFQIPFTDVNGHSLKNWLKKRKIDSFFCNSHFTKGFIDSEFGVDSQVVYPPVAIEDFGPGKKENLILSVGRFTKAEEQGDLIRPLHSKKQDVLIEVFRQMCDQGLDNWRLVLVGGALKKDQSYLDILKKSAKGYPIEVKTNVDYNKLRDSYARAKIYWHAAGFSEDEEKHPERMEHFGIAIVEAMAAGCVPVVIGRGGIPEIVIDGENGFLWQARDELAKLTIQLTKSAKKMRKISVQAIKDSRRFNKKVFYQKIDEIIGS